VSSRGKDDSSKEGPLELAGLCLVVLAVIVFLVWMAGSTRIVVTFTPLLRRLGSMWTWLPGEAGAPSALEMYRTARIFLQRPEQVDFFSFVAWINLAITPLALIATAGMAIWLCTTLARPKTQAFRRFSDADTLMQGVSRVFTGVAPILHIRKDIAQHKDPLWARQRFPEEVLFQERVNAEPLVGRDVEQPEKQKPKLDVIERWFKGLESTPGWQAKNSPASKRWHSRTLGRQIVELNNLGDRKLFAQAADASAPSFVDRFSDVGKVMFGLLCAHAFAGKEGMEDYRKARDELNNSCRGAAHGLPNLQVAQWIVDKYRHNDLARRMFAVHHWEYTYWFELFVQAKRRGKIPDSEFRWLKPADRTLWYTLNTVGRFTPHTESAAAFNMHAFERRCAQSRRWPLRFNGQTNQMEPSIFVKGAVEGLALEFERFVTGIDEDDNEWWKDRDEWLASNWTTLIGSSAGTAPPVPDTAAAAALAADTEFDRMQTQARAEARDKARKSDQQLLQSELDAMASAMSGVIDPGAGTTR
jgi:hypothetical protein